MLFEIFVQREGNSGTVPVTQKIQRTQRLAGLEFSMNDSVVDLLRHAWSLSCAAVLYYILGKEGLETICINCSFTKSTNAHLIHITIQVCFLFVCMQRRQLRHTRSC